MRDEPPVTVRITDDELRLGQELAERPVATREVHIARALAEARAAGYTAGLAPVQQIAAQIDGRMHLGPVTLERVRAIVDDALGRSS
jgi:hypothetical protein